MISFGFEGYEVLQVSPVRIFITKEGKPVFCGVDVAKLLGYKNPSIAVHDNCKNAKVINFYDSSKRRMLHALFIEQDELIELVKNRVKDAYQFINDILVGDIPEIEVGKNTDSFVLVNLDKSEQVIEYQNRQYKIQITSIN